MEGFANFLNGFEIAFTFHNLLACIVGVTLGTFIGVLPGIGALAGISILLPVTYAQDPTAALIMLAGIFYGTNYGGSVAAIMLNLPGTAASAVTCIDGYPMAKQGRGGIALFMCTVGSFIGACFAILLMMLFSGPLAEIALSFGAPEYFSLMVLGLVAASALTSGSPTKGLMMVVVGILLGSVGLEYQSATERFMYGRLELADGVALVVIAMGLFGISEIVSNLITMSDDKVRLHDVDLSWKALWPKREDFNASWMPIARGTVIGAFFGALPGAGGVISTFFSYALEKRLSDHPEKFGHGAIEGLVSAESSNNSAAQAAFIPTLSLGIPGNSIMALMLGALMIHGIVPGPSVIKENPDMFWGLIASFWIGNVLLVILNIPLIGVWVRILAIPYHVLFPSILFFICVGAFAFRHNAFDVYMVAAFGVAGYGLKRLDYPVAPLILAFVLGPLVEETFKRAMLLSRGDLSIFITHPVSLGCLLVTVAFIMFALWTAARARRQGIELKETGED